MNIDFNQLMNVVLKAESPETSITIGERSYVLRRMTVADAALFEGVGSPREGESGEAFARRVTDLLRGLFEGEVPPFLTEPVPTDSQEKGRYIAQINVLLAVIGELVMECISFPKRMARVREEARQQIEAARGSD